eukprot:1831463-Amphidinium_carterae.1
MWNFLHPAACAKKSADCGEGKAVQPFQTSASPVGSHRGENASESSCDHLTSSSRTRLHPIYVKKWQYNSLSYLITVVLRISATTKAAVVYKFWGLPVPNMSQVTLMALATALLVAVGVELAVPMHLGVHPFHSKGTASQAQAWRSSSCCAPQLQTLAASS